jgi:hypothetical protein
LLNLIFVTQILILFIICIFFFVNYSRSLFGQKGYALTRDELIGWQSTLSKMVEEAENAAKEITSKIESKVEELNKLLKEADKKIEELKSFGVPLNYLQQEKPSFKKDVPLIHKPAWKRVKKRDSDYKGIEIKKIQESVNLDNKKDELARRALLDRKPLSSRHIKIYELADLGWDVVDIAKETKVGKGEVQLILDLRKELLQ